MELELEEFKKKSKMPWFGEIGKDYPTHLAEIHAKWVDNDCFKTLDPGYRGSEEERSAQWRIRHYKKAIDEYAAFDAMMAGKYGADWKETFENGSGTRK